MGQNIVEPEQRGLGPLAVRELAEEFRRLAAEARTCIDDTHPWEAEPASRAWAERAETWDEAAKMLEEKLY